MKRNDDRALFMYQLYQDGMSLAAVGRVMGISRQTVFKQFKVRSFRLRPQLRYGQENHFFLGGARSSKKASHILEKAVKRGIVVPGDCCEQCGEMPSKYKDGRSPLRSHHDDYLLPLNVRWLCQRCHVRTHQEANHARD